MATKVLVRFSYLIFILFILINLLGVFMPEVGFDALWYHLTLNKLLLSKHQWYFPGGLFYYSAMPRLGELISLPLFSLFGYVGSKLLQFTAGLVTCFFIFRLVYRFTDSKLFSITAVNLFYATWLVSWQSSSGHIDLIRTAFESAALYLLSKYQILNIKSKITIGILFGLAIGTKWHALGSLLIYALVFSPAILIPALLTASPWFLIAYHFTKNPVYPIFESFSYTNQLSEVSPNFFSSASFLVRFISAPVFLTKPFDDFLSPVMGIVYLVACLGILSSSSSIRRISLVGFLGVIFVLLTPPPSSRYLLPFLPALVISSTYIVSRFKPVLSIPLVYVFTLSSLLLLGARTIAFAKYVPYLTGRLSKNEFLASLSYRLPDTFIDSDGYISSNLPPEANYLISNKLHNLYYFPYDFDHESFSNHKKSYDYLITTKTDPRTVTGSLIHTNSLDIQVFKL